MSASKCMNKECEHHKSGGGCKLFEGLTFVRCRQCII